MGCLNDEGQFSHWFGNIHLSGPCNRSCYFCIGQHMMGLDQENSLKRIPTNIGKFLRECRDVHYVEVESVNLYANGQVSITYPITKGYDPSGEVLPQYRFPGGRIHEQWLETNS
jgi:hypothetical protein